MLPTVAPLVGLDGELLSREGQHLLAEAPRPPRRDHDVIEGLFGVGGGVSEEELLAVVAAAAAVATTPFITSAILTAAASSERGSEKTANEIPNRTSLPRSPSLPPSHETQRVLEAQARFQEFSPRFPWVRLTPLKSPA